MKPELAKSVWQTVGLGIIAGMRTIPAPVFVNEILKRRSPGRLNQPLKLIRSDNIGLISKLLAAGELIVDKLPSTPSRANPAGLAARCLSGALAGACIFNANGKNSICGAFLGCLTAGMATFLSHALRKKIVSKTRIDDPWIGAMEDALVMASGLVLVNNS
jgi:uncharacterized membrane protein